MELIGDDKYKIPKRDIINCSRCERVFSDRNGSFYRNSENSSGFRYECSKCTDKAKLKLRWKIQKQMRIDSGAWMGSKERKALINYKKSII